MPEDLEKRVKINPVHGAVVGLASGILYAGAYVLFKELDISFNEFLLNYSKDIALFTGTGSGIGLMKDKYLGAINGGIISLTGGIISKSYFLFNHPEMLDQNNILENALSEGLVLILIGSLIGGLYNYACQEVKNYGKDDN